MIDQECIARDQLKQYIAGWADPDQSSMIEAHLSQCDDCEQTITALEQDPDTLVDWIRRDSAKQDETNEQSSHEIDLALAAARSLMPGPTSQDTESANQRAASSDVPTQYSAIAGYELLRPLGAGGMGSVYLAKHLKLGKEVAIKILPTRQFHNELFTARFQREIRAAGGLEHPSIVRATDAGEQNGTHYLVMEHIDGLDVSRVARSTSTLSIPDACEIARQTALGLAHAHANGIVHRDIKPSNVMLGKTGQAKILDFGLARVGPWESESAELTTVGQLMGTLDYMAPEQAEHPEAVDYRADLYSLGATLFRLLCGRAPLAASPGMSPLAKLRLLANHKAPRLDTLRSDAPKELVDLIESLLDRDPNQRPPSADHVAESLASFTDGQQLQELARNATEKEANAPSGASSSFQNLVLPSVQASDIPPTRRSRRWLAAFAIPLGIVAAILITLETQKGLLVIKSDADASVRLLKDGEVYKEVKVVPGANSTKIYAGRYGVELDAGSDSLELADNVISVSRSGTSIVTIQIKDHDNSPDATNGVQVASSAPAPNPNETLYNGKTLSSYLNAIQVERSPEGLGEAYEAIDALTSPATAPQVTEAILKFLPSVSPGLELMSGEGELRGKSSVDGKCFDLLRKANPGPAFADLVINEISKSTGEWSARLLSRGLQFADDQQRERFFDWLAENVVRKGSSHPLFNETTQTMVGWYHSSRGSDSFGNRIGELLTSTKDLDRSFWLRQVMYSNGGQSGYRALELAKPQCIETLLDENATQAHVAQAAITLLILAENGRLSASDVEKVRAIKSRIENATTEQLLELTTLDPTFGHVAMTMPNWDINSIQTRASQSIRTPFFGTPTRGTTSRGTPKLAAFRIESKNRNSDTHAISKLIELAMACQVDIQPSISLVLKKTEKPHADISPVLRDYRGYITLEWPDLKPTQFMGAGQASRGLIPSIGRITTKQWIGYFLHERCNRIIAESEPKPDDTAKPQPSRRPSSVTQAYADRFNSGRSTGSRIKPSSSSASEPLYKGKPLSEWLNVLSRETSRAGIEEALAAIEAMISKETSKQISTGMDKILRNANWKGSSFWRRGFELLNSSQPDFHSYCVKELQDSKDTEWKKKILKYAMFAETELEKSEPLHDYIVKTHLSGNATDFTSVVAESYRSLANSRERNSKFRKVFADALDKATCLSDDFWTNGSASSLEYCNVAIKNCLKTWKSNSESTQKSADSVNAILQLEFVRLHHQTDWSKADSSPDENETLTYARVYLQSLIEENKILETAILERTQPALFPGYGNFGIDASTRGKPVVALVCRLVLQLIRFHAPTEPLVEGSKTATQLKRLITAVEDGVATSWLTKSQVAMDDDSWESPDLATTNFFGNEVTIWPLDLDSPNVKRIGADNAFRNLIFFDAIEMLDEEAAKDACEKIQRNALTKAALESDRKGGKRDQ